MLDFIPMLHQRRDYLLLVVLATLWGASYTFIRIGVETIPPATLIAGRTLLAGAILAGIAAARQLPVPRSPRLLGEFAIQALFSSAIPFTTVAWGEQRVDASVATILNALTPLFAFVLSAVVLRREAITARKVGGVALGILGVLVTTGAGAIGLVGRDVGPQLAIVTASLFYASGAIYGRRFADLNAIIPAAGSLLVGSVVLIPIALIVDRPWTIQVSAASLAALLLLSIFSTALAFVIYFHLVRSLGPLATTTQSFLRVPIGVAVAAITLGEKLTWNAWVGLVLVFVAVMMLVR